MYRIDIGGNLRELLYEPPDVQKPKAKVSAMYLWLINVCVGGAGRAPGTFLEQRYTHTGAPALVPFELIQTLQSHNEVSSDLVLLVERRTASAETALSPRTNYQ